MARSFIGTNFLHSVDAPFTATPAAFAMWIFPTEATASRLIYVKDYVNGDYIGMGFNADLSVSCNVYDGATGASATSPAGSIKLNQWQHIFGQAASSTNRTIWIDGVLQNTETTSITATISATQRFDIASYNNESTLCFIGYMAEVAVWDAQFSAIWPMMLSGKFGVPFGELSGLPIRVRPDLCRGYWPLYGGPTTEYDFSYSARHMPNAGATAPGIVPHPEILSSSRGTETFEHIARGLYLKRHRYLWTPYASGVQRKRAGTRGRLPYFQYAN